MTAVRSGTGPAGPAGADGAVGPRGAQGTIGGLVLTTPPAMAFGRALGTIAPSGAATTADLVTTDNVNAGETVILNVSWQQAVTPVALSTVTDGGSKATWIIDATTSANLSQCALVIGQCPSGLPSGSTIRMTWAAGASNKSAGADAWVGVFSPGASTIAGTGTANAAVGTVNLTTGSLTTTATTELVIALWSCKKTGGGAYSTVTPAAGWTLLDSSPKASNSASDALVAMYKIVTPGTYSPTGTLAATTQSTFASLIARYQAGVSWVNIPSVTSEKLWVTDPNYGAAGDGITDDATAINAAIAAGVAAIGGGGIVAFEPSKTYMIGAPLEVLGRVKIQGFEARNTILKLTAGFNKSQMLRNWPVSAWGGGESDGRVFPLSITAVPYPQISGLHLHGNGHANVSLVAWVGPQETSYFDNLILEPGFGTDGNQGVWGFDLRSTSGQTFNGGRIRDCTLYGEGWERQISIDGILGGGSDMQVTNIVFSPAQIYHSLVYVSRVFGVHFQHLHWESETNSAALGTFALVSAYGFAMSDCNSTVKTVNNKPFIAHTRRASGPTIETPADVRGVNFNYQGGTPTSDWPGGFITDLWNTVNAYGTVTVNGSSATVTNPPRMLHRYNGAEMVWTDNAEGLHKLP